MKMVYTWQAYLKPELIVVILLNLLQFTIGRDIQHEVWGDIRLVNGSTVYEGRVEVKVNGTWGTVCDDQWSMYDGMVVCRQLGFDRVYRVMPGGYYGQGKGPIFHDDLICTNRENSLDECPGTHDPNKTDCVHAEDAGIKCQPPYYEPTTVASLICTSQQFMCATNAQCIPKRWLCDRQRDCSDGSDEYVYLCHRLANCGMQPVAPVSRRIVGGSDVRAGTWPWMASLRVVMHATMTETVLCGGTLIDSKWVLTAAHCFENFKASSSTFKVVVGDYDSHVTEPSEQTVDVSHVYINNRYRTGTHNNDIALIKLRYPINTSKGEVTPACLPIHGAQRFGPGDGCYVTGWGETRGTGPAGIMRQAMVPIVNKTTCSEWYNQTIHPGSMCAGYQFGGIDACKGDSGGPLSCHHDGRWYVTGIVSWGDGCAKVQHPGIYTDVAHYISWIAKVIHTHALSYSLAMEVG